MLTFEELRFFTLLCWLYFTPEEVSACTVGVKQKIKWRPLQTILTIISEVLFENSEGEVCLLVIANMAEPHCVIICAILCAIC